MIARVLIAILAFITLTAPVAHAQRASGELVFGIAPTEQSDRAVAMWTPFVDDLRRETGLNIVLRTATDYAGIIEAMRSNQIHVAWLTNVSGLEAMRRANAEVFAKSTLIDGQVGYRALIVVPRDSPLRTLDDLLVCNRTLDFGLGDPLSTSGTLVPQAYIFAARGIDPQTCFNQVTNAAHESNLLAVANGQLDAATNNTNNIDRLRLRNPAVLDRIRIIWRSPLIQNDPIMWRRDLDPAVKREILQFFLTYGWRGDAQQRARERRILGNLLMNGFLPATDDHFLPIIRLEVVRDLSAVSSDPNLDEPTRAARIAALQAQLADLDRREAAVAAVDLSAQMVAARARIGNDGSPEELEALVAGFMQDQDRPVARAARIDRPEEIDQSVRGWIGLVVGLLVAAGIYFMSRPPQNTPARRWTDRVLDAVTWGGFVGLLVWSFWSAEVFKLPLLAENADRMGDYLAGFTQPDFTDWRMYLTQVSVTVQIALWGTFLAVALAIPLGLLGASNISPFWIRRPVRWVMDAMRAINELVVAAVFVAAVGLGPFAGVMALAFHTAGVLGKLFSEAVEAIDSGPVEGVRATGAGPLNEVTWGVIPQVIPLWASYALYRFEANTRAATILGLIGAGGIGQVLIENIRAFQYGKTAVVIGIIIIAVTLADMLSQVLRRRLI